MMVAELLLGNHLTGAIPNRSTEIGQTDQFLLIETHHGDHRFWVLLYILRGVAEATQEPLLPDDHHYSLTKNLSGDDSARCSRK